MASYRSFMASLRRVRVAAILPILIALAALSQPAAAATKVWNNAAGGTWSTAANWTGGLPAAGDDVDITLAGSYTVTLDVSTSIQQFVLGGASGTQTLSIASAVTMDGGAAVGGTTSVVNANGVLQISAGTLRMGASGASAPYVVNVDGKFDWSGGTLTISNFAGSSVTISASGVLAMSGSGVMKVDGGGNGFLNSNSTAATWSGTNTLSIVQSHFVNNGTMVVSGNPFIDDKGQFTNNGTLTFTGDPTITATLGNSSGAVVNTGIFRKNGSAGALNVNLDNSSFVNSGLVDAKTGTINFNNVSGASFGSSGAGNAFNADPGAAISFGVPASGGAPLAFRGTTFTGPGTQTLLGTGSTDYQFFGTITATNLTLANGLFHPADAVTFNGLLNWNGGTIASGVSLAIAAGSTLDIKPGAFPKAVTLCCGAPAFQNFGTVTVNPGVSSLNFATNAGFWNRAGGTFNVNNTLSLGMQLAEFRNDGAVQLGFPVQLDVAGGGGVVFNNAGTVNVNGSALFMNASPGNSYVQSAGVTDLGAPTGAISMSANDPFTINGGTFKGNGALGLNANVSVNAGGTIAPSSGGAVGTIQITGPYNQNGGTFAVDLNGTNPGVTYDQLSVSGAATLGGPLNVTLGFAPPAGTVFIILFNSGAGAVTGTFTGLPEAATFAAGGTSLRISYIGGTGNDVTLTVVAGAGMPTTTTVVPAPNPSVVGQNVTLTATVLNNAPANGVTPPGGVGITGSVQFKDGAANLGTPVTLVGGVATFATSALAVGSHPITVVYSGDLNFASSTSPAVTQVVNPAATTTTISSALPAVLSPGQSVTVSVMVAAVAPGSGTPAGTVNVLDGAAPLCTVTLVGAAGSCSAPLVVTGLHMLTASYVATPNFLASTSSPVTVTVNAVVPVTGTPIPTLEEWALFALALMLFAAGVGRVRRRT